MRYLIVFTILIMGCNANWHLKQSKKQYEKALKKGYLAQVDTVYQIDSVYLDRVVHDTLFHDTEVHDTLVIEKDRLRIKYFTKNDTVYLEGECLPDTLIREIPITVQETVYIKQNPLEWAGINTIGEKIVFFVGLGLLLVLIIAIFLAKIVK